MARTYVRSNRDGEVPITQQEAEELVAKHSSWPVSLVALTAVGGHISLAAIDTTIYIVDR